MAGDHYTVRTRMLVSDRQKAFEAMRKREQILWKINCVKWIKRALKAEIELDAMRAQYHAIPLIGD